MNNKKIAKYFFPILIGLLVFLMIGCSNKLSDSVDIKLNDLEPVEKKEITKSEGKELRVAIASINSPKNTIIYYNDLLKYIEKDIGIPVKVIQKKTYQEVNDLIEKGEVDLAFICTYAYTLGNKEFGLEPFIVPQVNGKVTYQSYIIVAVDSNYYEFADLNKKKVAFTDPLSNSGYLYPTYVLKQEGKTPELYFKDYIFTYSHDNSIKAVREKVVDGAAVDGLVFDYIAVKQPSLLEDIRIINKSPEFGIPPIVVSSSMNKELKEKIRNILLNMHLTQEGKKILDYLYIEKFLDQDDEKYNSARYMAGEVFSGK
ncbi:MAG: hypothetical protein JM58_01725 [Peptococcaceae bacterium BICA1-8]|nr:MAG: hypothetical protein JM58_01725 [Peptococcaceae bacterium BICA1-8]